MIQFQFFIHDFQSCHSGRLILIIYRKTSMTYDLEANAVMSFLNENHVGKKNIFTIRINSYDFRAIFAGIMIVEPPKKKKLLPTM